MKLIIKNIFIKQGELNKIFMPKDNNCLLIRVITKIIGIACLVSMLLSYKLWLNERTFPLSPVSDYLPIIKHPVDYILLGIVFILLLCICILSLKCQ